MTAAATTPLVAHPAEVAEAVAAARCVLAGRRLVALTGAGMSTESGIPDYRGPGSPARTPMTFQEFLTGPDAQRRYWARAHVGWGHMSRARPNDGHRLLARLEAAGPLTALITQNVDGLHAEAGQRALVTLHGNLADVVCLRCGHRSARTRLHERLSRLNPGYAEQAVDVAPDGDALLTDTASFRLAPCELCGGPLKPDVVFFGESVPKPTVAHCFGLVAGAGALLVAGSSLQVMSGLRFVRAAAKAGTPVVIVNRGTTRGDALATVKVEAGCTETLRALVAGLT